jgi:hypothetical protein
MLLRRMDPEGSLHLRNFCHRIVALVSLFTLRQENKQGMTAQPKNIQSHSAKSTWTFGTNILGIHTVQQRQSNSDTLV